MNKELHYQEVYKQIESLVSEETDLIANLGNIASVLHFNFNFHWTGFYFVKGNSLVLGPFQGPVACTRINFGKGVCGTAWEQKKTIIVDDVHKFKGHIACSPYSNSEIVLPLIKDNQAWGVLDIDSTKFACFDKTDEHYLLKICGLIS